MLVQQTLFSMCKRKLNQNFKLIFLLQKKSDLEMAQTSEHGLTPRVLFSLSGWWRSLSPWQPSSWLGYSTTKDMLDHLPRDSRRFIKTHLPLSLLPPNLLNKAKVMAVPLSQPFLFPMFFLDMF